MANDQAMSKPGPMGWGVDSDSIKDKFNKERKAFERLATNKSLGRRPAKTVNERALQLVLKHMDEDGIEGGFSCRHLERAIFKRFLPWKRQLIGSCVASGGMRAMTRRTLAEVFLLMQREELFGTEFTGTNNVAMFAPYSYRAGRSKAGINGNMDGSFCSAHIEGAMDWGMIPCWANGLDSDDFPEPQNTRLYKQWGASDSLMNKFKSVGEKFLLLESEKITDFDQHWSALEDFKPQMVCSDWAFKPKAKHPTWKLADGSPVWIYTRDRSTSWAHNMTLDGALIHRGDKFTCVDNSWGDNAHKNGSFFVIEAEEMARWIRDAEIQTIGEIDLTDSGGAV